MGEYIFPMMDSLAHPSLTLGSIALRVHLRCRLRRLGALVQQQGWHRFSERDSCQIYQRSHGIPQDMTAFVLIRRTCFKLVQCT